MGSDPAEGIFSRIFESVGRKATIAQISQSAGVHSSSAVHSTAISRLYINCESHQLRRNLHLFANYSPACLPVQNQRDARLLAFSNLSGAQLSDLQLLRRFSSRRSPISDAATNVFPLDITYEHLLAFPVIDVLIGGLDQQFSASLAESHHLT